MTTTAEPEVSANQERHDELFEALTNFNVGSGPSRAQIREADYYRTGCDDVDWWEGAGHHFRALIEAATTLAKEAEDFEKTVRSVMASLDCGGE